MMATLLALDGAREVVGYDLNAEKIDLFKRLLFYIDPEDQECEAGSRR